MARAKEIKVKVPNLTDYESIPEFIRDRLRFRKQTEEKFSVARAARSIRRMSPALVSLVVHGKRRLTSDRVEAFSKLMALAPSEKKYLRAWVERDEGEEFSDQVLKTPGTEGARAQVGVSILNDWLNVYVKDLFQIPRVQKDADLVFSTLSPLASQKRIQRSIQFLLREGHLRQTPDGRIVPEVSLSVADPGVSNKKIRHFHKAALALAAKGIELYSSDQRFANCCTLTLDRDRYADFLALVADFSEKVQSFAESEPDPESRLYQFVLNLTPVGGNFP